MQHLWDHTASTLQNLFPAPAGWELTFRTEQIPALQADQKAEAEVLEVQATTIREFIDAGFTHESAIEAVDQGDLTLLVKDEEVVPSALDVAAETDTDEEDEGVEDDNTLAFLSA